MYYPRLTKVIIHHFLTKNKTISKRNKISMHTSRDDYLINTLRFVSIKEEFQIYRARLPKSMTSPEMRETKAYKTYLGYATRLTPPKKARKFKKLASLKLSTVPASPEEPTRKLKRKEKMSVEKRKGIDLLSEVALTEEAQYEEVRTKSLRDFHKTHLNSSGVPNVTKEESTESEDESWGRDEYDNNNDQDSRSEGNEQESDSGEDNTQSDNEKGSNSEHETDENNTGSESDQQENEEDVEDDKEEKDDELVKTPSNSTDDEDETNVEDKSEVNTDEGLIQKEGTDAEMINVHQENKNPEITINQVIKDAHVTLSIVPQKTEVP
ncbi:hypothetical protein Tco_0933106, partial [Tanacetum coccineum]